MTGLGGMFKPHPAMVKQLLLASGHEDPHLLAMVDRIMADGCGTPHLAPFFGDTMRVPEDAQSLLVTLENAVEDITILVTCRRKQEKTLDNPK